MKTERKIDALGRLVLPIQFRRKLGLKKNSTVIIELKGGNVLITPKALICRICGDETEHLNELHICDNCLSKAKKI